MNLNEVVYVGNVPKQATDSELADFFKDVGKVVKVSFMRENRNDCRSKVGFVLFENEMQALKACSFDQTIFQWNRVIVMLVTDERHFWAGHTVIVRNMAYETSEEDLYESFSRYGMIEGIQIPTNNFAYIGFKEKSAAVSAQRLSNTVLGKSKITVQVLQRNIRVRLEDLDSFKAPRVYNELMDAKLKYKYTKDKESGQDMMNMASSNVQFNDYDDYDDEDDRIYDPITNRFYDKPKTVEPEQDFAFDEDVDIPCPSPLQWHNREVDPSPNHSPRRDIFDEPREEPEETPGEIRRRELTFVKTGIVPVTKTAVKVENIPRDVYDEDVVKYFDQFGPIISMEIGSSACAFTKIYTVIFDNERTTERVADCFMRKCEFSGVVCTVFTMRPDDALLEVPGKCVLVDYISGSIVFEDVVDAFREVGQVIYVQKTAKNQTPSVVHFRHSISIDRAKEVTKIDGDKVRVVPFSQEAFRNFTAENSRLKKASVPYTKKPLKNVRMMDIQMTEQTEKSSFMIVRTVFNPNYRNPEPDKLTNEVIIYNCPTRTTLKDLRRHFINVAFVTNMRYEQSAYDTNTWKVYASFASFNDAWNAVRLKGAMQSYPIFKHLATEKPKLDSLEALLIECEMDDISVNKMYQALVSHGAMTFVDKVGHNNFIAFCRDAKTAKKLIQIKSLARSNCKVTLYRDILNMQNTQACPEPLKQNNLPQQQQIRWQQSSTSQQNLPIPMDEIIALQQRIMNDEYEGHASSRDNRHRSPARETRYDNEWEQEFSRDRRDTAVHRRHSVDMDLADDEPGQFENYNQHQSRFVQNFDGPGQFPPSFEREGALSYTNPPAPNEMPFGMPPRDFSMGWAPGGPMHQPPTIVPPPMNRNIFMAPVNMVPPMGSGIFGGPIPIPNITIHHIQPNAGPNAVPNPVPQDGDLRDYLAEKRNTRSRDVYDPTEEFDREIENINSGRAKSPNEIDRLEGYIREKEREIERRLKLLDRKLTTDSEPEKPRERSVSPTDRRAHDRIEEIRKETVVISRQMADLRKIDQQNGPLFNNLKERQSMLDKERLEIKRQLEAKKLWLAERARSLSRERHDEEDQQRKTSAVAEKRSRSSSRGRRRSKSRNRMQRDQARASRRSRSRARRSRSNGRLRRNRSSSREHTRNRSRSNERRQPQNKRRPESLMREMRQLGLPNQAKSDHSVYVGNIAEGVRNDELKATFTRYGRIVDFDFSFRDKYGEIYIDYHQREDAFKALEMNSVKICGKRLRVALNCRKPANRDGYSVIVEMPEPVPERVLYTKFDSCGSIEFIWHYDNFTIATITFERPESMLMALAVRELHNRLPIIVREYVETER